MKYAYVLTYVFADSHQTEVFASLKSAKRFGRKIWQDDFDHAYDDEESGTWHKAKDSDQWNIYHSDDELMLWIKHIKIRR